MYKEKRIFTIKDIKCNHKKTPTIWFGGMWLNELGYFSSKRILVKTINENEVFSFEIFLLD